MLFFSNTNTKLVDTGFKTNDLVNMNSNSIVYVLATITNGHLWKTLTFDVRTAMDGTSPQIFLSIWRFNETLNGYNLVASPPQINANAGANLTTVTLTSDISAATITNVSSNTNTMSDGSAVTSKVGSTIYYGIGQFAQNFKICLTLSASANTSVYGNEKIYGIKA